MSFTKEFRYQEIYSLIHDLSQTFYNWEEYDPCMCGEEENLRVLAKELEELLEKASEVADKMHKINVDSFGC